jgi:hypothetical protein
MLQGLALAACLLNDPEGPLYHPCSRGGLAQLADEATSALAAHEHVCGLGSTAISCPARHSSGT